MKHNILTLLIFFKDKVRKSLRLQLLTTFIACILIAFIAAFIFFYATDSFFTSHYKTIEMEQQKFDDRTGLILEKLNQVKPMKMAVMEQLLDKSNRQHDAQLAVVNEKGLIVAESNWNPEDKLLDLHTIMKSKTYHQLLHNRYVQFFPLDSEQPLYFIAKKELAYTNATYKKNNPFIPIVFLLVFILSFYLLTKGKIRQIERITDGVKEFSNGNLDYEIAAGGEHEIGQLAGHVNDMARKLNHAIEEERKAETIKRELITNISHDLRTPLTSIIGYLNIIIDKKFSSEEKKADYLQVVYDKSVQLKSLIDDLFEYTKLENKGMVLSEENVNVIGMIEQLADEMNGLAEENQLMIRAELPKDPVMISADPIQLVRVFDNLLTNAIKYSIKPGVISISSVVDEGHIVLSFKNKTDILVEEDVDRLFERFYKKDQSRTSQKHYSSGLGLAIAKSITALHHGTIWVETKDEYIEFNVKLPKSNL